MSDCVCCENRRSRPRWSVTLATTATAITGTAAMMENKATMRTCNRAAARPRRLACTTPHSSRAMTRTRRKTVTALASSNVTTTSCVGAIGVRPASTTKVRTADSSASATAARPSARESHPDAGAAAAVASSVVAASPTLIIDASRPKREPHGACKCARLGAPH